MTARDARIREMTNTWEQMLREARHEGWCKGRDAAAAEVAIFHAEESDVASLYRDIRALKSPYEVEG